MNYLTFCSNYNYNLRDDMARESYSDFIRFFNFIHNQNCNIELLAFLGLKGYAKHVAKR